MCREANVEILNPKSKRGLSSGIVLIWGLEFLIRVASREADIFLLFFTI